MNSWRDAILAEFTPHAARLTIAADPDGLLREERILKEIGERGFELMAFEDHVAFRYAYESRFRSRWDRGEHADLVVGVRARRRRTCAHCRTIFCGRAGRSRSPWQSCSPI